MNLSMKNLKLRSFWYRLSISFVVTCLLTGCADLNIGKDNAGAGLLEFGQHLSYENCKSIADYTAREECMARIDENYRAYK